MRSRLLAVALCGAAVLAAWPWLFGMSARAEPAPGAPSVEEILANVLAEPWPPAALASFEQHVETRLLFRTWRFVNKATRSEDGFRIVLGGGAPSFFPEDLGAELFDLRASFDGFAFELDGVETVRGTPMYRLIGTRLRYNGRGAQEGTLWINAESWRIERADLHYSWGSLAFDQYHRKEAGHWVLDRQEAVARAAWGLGARIDVHYQAYRFE